MTSLCEPTTDEQAVPALTSFIAKEFLFGGGREELNAETPLIESGIVDSMGIFRLIAFLEETFDVVVEPEEVVIDHFASIAAVARLVADKTGSAA